MTHPGATSTASPSHPNRLERDTDQVEVPPTLSTAAIGGWTAPASLWTERLSGHEPRNPFEMWLSLFPIAPLFGVRWIWSSSPSAAYDAMMALRDRSVGEAPAAVSSTSWTAPPRPLSPDEAAARAELEALKLGESQPEPQPVLGQPQEQSQSQSLARGPLGAPLTPMTKPVATTTPAADGGSDVETPPNLFRTRPAQTDDLTRINGVGPRVVELLNEAGVYQYAQIAEMTPAQLRWLDERLFVFKGRAERDAWAPQARLLVESD